MQLEGVKWFCKDCQNSFKIVQERINIVNHLNTNEAENNIKFDSILSRLESIECKINENDNKIVSELKQVSSANSYADVLKNNKQKSPDHVIILKPKNKNKKRFEAKNEIREKLDPQKIPVNGMHNAANGGIIISCKNQAATKIVEQEINNQFGDEFEIRI
jgi:hypothetical protein